MRRLDISQSTCLLLGLVFVVSLIPVAYAQAPQYSFQVGAWGDDASKGNMGVQADIRTHVYGVYPPDLTDSFWVGDNLDNGAFIQFGYHIEPGYFCVRGHFISGQNTCTGGGNRFGTDARWFWQYWPNGHGSDYYYASGSANSAGADGAWHTYAISPNVANGWDFVLDGQPIDSVSFSWTHSKDPVFMVAEKYTSSNTPGTLGPVEFRNLAYLKEAGWHKVDSLYVLRGCGYGSPCVLEIPYGIQLVTANDIVAGSGEPKLLDSQLLWPRTYVLGLAIPSGAQVDVDGIAHSGFVDLSLSRGPHLLSAQDLIQVNSATRLRFANWSDGSTDRARTIDLSSDMSLEAMYVTQYKLTIHSSFPVSGDGWYDQGTTAFFSTNVFPRVTEDSLRFFAGWSDRTGKVVTFLPSGSIVMDGSYTLETDWFPLYWPVLVAFIGGVIALLEIRNRMRRSAESESIHEKKMISYEIRAQSSSTPGRAPEETEFMVCRFCGGKIPRGILRCPECGMTVRFLGPS